MNVFESPRDARPGIVCLSGGLDSTTLLYLLTSEKIELEALSFNYGAKHNLQELQAADYFCKKLGVKHHRVDLSFVNQLFTSSLLQSGEAIPDGSYCEANMKSTVVPFRNAIFLSLAVGLAESRGLKAVYLATHSGDRAVYPDCSPGFNQAIKQAAKLGTDSNISIELLFQDLKKSDITALAKRLNLEIGKTYTCYKGKPRHCGVCAACIERRKAILGSFEVDPTEYILSEDSANDA